MVGALIGLVGKATIYRGRGEIPWWFTVLMGSGGPPSGFLAPEAPRGYSPVLP